jgi:hypothetical protein
VHDHLYRFNFNDVREGYLDVALAVARDKVPSGIDDLARACEDLQSSNWLEGAPGLDLDLEVTDCRDAAASLCLPM